MNDKKAYIEQIVGKPYKFNSFDLLNCKEGVALLFSVYRDASQNISKMFENFDNNLVYHVKYTFQNRKK